MLWIRLVAIATIMSPTSIAAHGGVSKILFVSQESSADVIEEALRLGAMGYVIKTHAGSELLAAMNSATPQSKQTTSLGYINTPALSRCVFRGICLRESFTGGGRSSVQF
jgi:DNA-binding response OmpR family regulator